MQNGGEKLHLLLVPLGEFLDLLFAIGSDRKTLKPLVQFFLGRLLRYAVQPCQEKQLFVHPHLRVESPLFWEITPVPARHLADISAIPGDATTIRTEDVQNHAHGPRFSRAVWSQEAKDCSLFHFHGQVFDDVELCKRLIDMFN